MYVTNNAFCISFSWEGNIPHTFLDLKKPDLTHFHWHFMLGELLTLDAVHSYATIAFASEMHANQAK